MKVHAEIMCDRECVIGIHSDICPPDCDSKHMNDLEYKKLLHECLDDWLEKSNGTGGFYIKQEGYNLEDYE